MTATEVMDATLEPGISNGRPVAVFRSVDHHTGDEVRLRVTKRGHHTPDHIATYRVFHEPAPGQPGLLKAAQVTEPEPIPTG
ncbi:MAG: hypothetical protein F4Y40_10075 [Acidimicrobiia bacterium]|nr:hypothetical protein [Acidimicrobiia bacterium]